MTQSYGSFAKDSESSQGGLPAQSNFMNPLVSNQIAMNPKSLGKSAVNKKFDFNLRNFDNGSAGSVDKRSGPQ